MKNKYIILTGPTGVGKTKISIKLAQIFDGEIISADSMQIYKYMDIGTAKITKEEMEGIKHHLIDTVTPDEYFSVADFEMKAKQLIHDINLRNKLPIIVGGTGLYINSLIQTMNYNAIPPNPDFRTKLESIRIQEGNQKLYELLKEKNSEVAITIHPNNFKRVIRALEILEESPEFYLFDNLKSKEYDKNAKIFVLNNDRKYLYEQINQRVNQMMEEGLITEVERLFSMGYSPNLPSMKGIGYSQLIQFLNGLITLEEAEDLIKRDSRRYAKRQITWFKKYPQAIWIQKNKMSDEEILQFLKDEIILHLQ